VNRICLTALLTVPLLAAPATAGAPASAGQVPIALLADLSSGQLLYADAPQKPFLPASVTKAMSALVAFDLIAAGKLREDQLLTVQPQTAARWAGQGTSMQLAAGQQVRVHDLVMGLMTVSANDAAVVLAEGATGSTEAWLGLMNAEAQRLGMKDSRFSTPNGWPDGRKTHVSARDLVRLADALVHRHPELYRRYIGQPAMQWQGALLRNRDPITGVVLGADGIKTGHTREAGVNFLGTAKRGERRLVLVIAGAASETQRAQTARELMEWGFTAWDSRILVGEGTRMGTARVQGGSARQVTLAVPHSYRVSWPKGTVARISARVIYRGPLRAPIVKGSLVAGLEVTVAGQGTHVLPLVATEDIRKAGPIDRVLNGLLGLVA